MQTSLNPLFSNIVEATGWQVALTFGQFVKAIASFWPLILPCGELHRPFRLSDWVAGAVPCLYGYSCFAIVLLGSTHIEEEKEEGIPVLSELFGFVG